MEDLENLIDDLEDFDLTDGFTEYEVCLAAYDKDGTELAVVTLDNGYTELEEARKCYNYFSDIETVRAYLAFEELDWPADVTRAVVDLVSQTGDDFEIIEEIEII